MAIRAFDLNIEKVLENWEVEHALREIIANALDEQTLTGSDNIEIYEDERGDWHIRDYGRGLRIEHFTLNENQEKLNASSGVIGRFGVGLKDALATFYRRGVHVLVRSPFGTFRLKQEHKHGFANIKTLHVEYDDGPNNIRGTDFILRDVTRKDIEKAKSMFLKFADEEILEKTMYGQILRRRGNVGRVYILGVLASEEPDFLFSYNITSLTDSMKKKLSRERLNLGRATYTERIKAILKGAKSELVQDLLIEQVRKRSTGEQCEEMKWIEISQMAINLMFQRNNNLVFLTEEEIKQRPNALDNIRRDGYDVVIIDEKQKLKLNSQVKSGGQQVRTLERYIREYNESFKYRFVDVQELTQAERRIYDLTPDILSLVGMTLDRAPQIRISETMRITSDDTLGVWDRSIPAIVIKRSVLSSLADYAATLLHELGHATTGASDATREFERVLTNYLGLTAVAALRK